MASWLVIIPDYLANKLCLVFNHLLFRARLGGAEYPRGIKARRVTREV